MITAFKKKIEIWAVVVLIPAALVAAGCTTSTGGSAYIASFSDGKIFTAKYR